jgi:hypothetical protein
MGTSPVLFEQLKDNRKVFMFPMIGPEMVAALLRPPDESEEPMEKVKPPRRPPSTSGAMAAGRRRLLTGRSGASHWIRFKLTLFAFCRRVSSV